MNQLISLSLLIVAIEACSAVTGYQQTGGAYPGRGPNCEFEVLRDPVLLPYEEIALLDIEAFYPKAVPNNDDDFKKVVAVDVCSGGGHAVIPVINNHGRYILGRIIRFQPRQCDKCQKRDENAVPSC